MRESAPPIESEGDLIRYFERGAKPGAEFHIGVEQEKIGVYADGRAIPYEGDNGIGAVLAQLAARGGYTPVLEEGRVIALERGRTSVTLEPGGQVELSGAIVDDAHAAQAQLGQHIRELGEISEPLGITWLAIGFRPFGTLEDVPWMPKGRYRIMRAYLPTRGRLAHEMMKRTATIQGNLDYEDEADAARKMRTAMGMSSILTAVCANSPIVDGRPSPYLTYRAAAWLETDTDRCGLLPFVFEPGDRLFASRCRRHDVPPLSTRGLSRRARDDGRLGAPPLDALSGGAAQAVARGTRVRFGAGGARAGVGGAVARDTLRSRGVRGGVAAHGASLDG
jgi:glutamate--cysteine ligase